MIRTIPDEVIENEVEADKLFDFLSEVSTRVVPALCSVRSLFLGADISLYANTDHH